jgi:hypothetical protein
MPTLIYRGALPSPEEFEREMANALKHANPVDDLLELAGELSTFEQRYQISSSDFYLKYQAGMLTDELQHCMEWAATYEVYTDTKKRIESALMRAAIGASTEEKVAV